MKVTFAVRDMIDEYTSLHIANSKWYYTTLIATAMQAPT